MIISDALLFGTVFGTVWFVSPVVLGFILQWRSCAKVAWHTSFIFGLPGDYGKWYIWGLWLGVFPYRIQSPNHPWRDSRDEISESCNKVYKDFNLFNPEGL